MVCSGPSLRMPLLAPISNGPSGIEMRVWVVPTWVVIWIPVCVWDTTCGGGSGSSGGAVGLSLHPGKDAERMMR